MGSQTMKIDDTLLVQLEQARPDGTIEAVITFRSHDPQRPAPAAAETKNLTDEILRRAEDETGDVAERVNVFKHLGSFAVKARPTFIKYLLDQPEVASAMANRQSDVSLTLSA